MIYALCVLAGIIVGGGSIVAVAAIASTLQAKHRKAPVIEVDSETVARIIIDAMEEHMRRPVDVPTIWTTDLEWVIRPGDTIAASTKAGYVVAESREDT